MENKNVNYKYIYILVFGIMLMMGFVDNLRGPLIPDIRGAFNVNYTSIGSMLFIASLGFSASTFIGGILCDRIGQKKVLLLGFLCAVSGIAGISYSLRFGVFLFMMGFLNIGLGALEMGVNSVVSGMPIKNQAVFLNLLHFFYGVGASIGPRYSGQLLDIQVPWQKIYLLSSAAVIMLFIYFLFLKFPERTAHGKEESIPFMQVIKDRKVVLFGVALGFYTASELGITNWLSNYLKVMYKMKDINSSFYVSLFFIVFTAGRLLGGFVVERAGYLKSVLVAMPAAFILFVIGISGGERFAFMLSLCGLFDSIVYPTIVAAAMKEFKKGTGSALGVIVTVSTCINMVSNWFIGKLNDIFNVQVGLSMVAFYMVLVFMFVVMLRKSTIQHKKIERV